MNPSLQKWKRAVVHLETACDKVDSRVIQEDFWEKRCAILARIEDGTISPAEGQDLSLEIWQENAMLSVAGGREIREQGTAIFLEDEGAYYLLTARHVLWDAITAERRVAEEQRRMAGVDEAYAESVIASVIETSANRIYSMIYRVPSFDEIEEEGAYQHREFLMNLSAGTYATSSYTFDIELDLAIISLKHQYIRFAEDLLRHGAEPISLADVAEEPSSEWGRRFYSRLSDSPV